MYRINLRDICSVVSIHPYVVAHLGIDRWPDFPLIAVFKLVKVFILVTVFTNPVLQQVAKSSQANTLVQVPLVSKITMTLIPHGFVPDELRKSLGQTFLNYQLRP